MTSYKLFAKAYTALLDVIASNIARKQMSRRTQHSEELLSSLGALGFPTPRWRGRLWAS